MAPANGTRRLPDNVVECDQSTRRERVFRLRPGLTARICGQNEVLVRHGLRSAFSTILHDDGQTGLLGAVVNAALQNRLKVDELVRVGDINPHAETQALELIDYLVAERILVPNDLDDIAGLIGVRFPKVGDGAMDSITVGVVGCGAVGRRVATEFAALGAKLLLLDHETSDLATALCVEGQSECVVVPGDPTQRSSLEEVLTHSDLTVVAVDGYSPATLHLANQAALETRRPWMSTCVDGSWVIVGPTFIPGFTPCYAEVEAQFEASLTFEAHYLAYRAAAHSAEVAKSAVVLPCYASVAAGWTVSAALTVLSGTPDLFAGRAIVVDFEEMAIDSVDILRLPRCPACRRPATRHAFL